MSQQPRPATRAVFTQGPVLRHVAVMTLTSSIGFTAVFLIDLLSMFYISLAGRDEWRAAVSLLSKVLFFPFALNMGMMIGIGTVVSVAIGRGDPGAARRAATTGLCLTALLGLVVSFGALPFRDGILDLFGAEGEARAAAARLLVVTLPANVLLSVGMACASILRAHGDPTRAMLVTLAGGIVISIADPLLIFGLRQGIDGVGMAILVSRIAFLAVGLWGTIVVHRALAPLRLPFRMSLDDRTAPRCPGGLLRLLGGLGREIRPIAFIAVPAMITNLAMPFADWYVTRTIWQFGVSASAAAGVYDRIMPLAFSLVFALTTSLGPIAGQNLGAKAFDRVRLTFFHALAIAGLYSLLVWLTISALAPQLAIAFGLAGGAKTFFLFLCRYATLAWVFVSMMLVANTMFNTLGRAHVSTLFNWGRATLGTIPFVWLGARSGGAETAMLGIAAAALIFAVAAVLVASRYTRRLGSVLPDGVPRPIEA